jgi:hypothetical protein
MLRTHQQEQAKVWRFLKLETAIQIGKMWLVLLIQLPVPQITLFLK